MKNELAAIEFSLGTISGFMGLAIMTTGQGPLIIFLGIPFIGVGCLAFYLGFKILND